MRISPVLKSSSSGTAEEIEICHVKFLNHKIRHLQMVSVVNEHESSFKQFSPNRNNDRLA